MGIANFKFSAHVDRNRTANQKNAKVGQEGRDLRHVTYFYNFWNPPYLWKG